jgi:putative membrane-bound dehydrogenase-like protein
MKLRCLPATIAILASALGIARGEDPKPLKVLLICGGCCHDYTKQKDIIRTGLADRAFIEVTTVQQGGTATNSKIAVYESVDWSKGYDVIIHDECFSDVKDSKYIANILAPHKKGLPAVALHCAMHSYRDGTDEWFKFLGVTSRRHGAAYPHEVLNADAGHPIMAGFGRAWANPAGELYWIEKVWPTAHPLATSKNKEQGNDEVCVWTNTYNEGTRVFGTTLGHHNETVSAPEYLDLLTRGTLWAAGKLGPAYLKPPKPKVVSANLAKGQRTLASSEESGKGNFARHAVDGNPGTRWCANGPTTNEWLQVDLSTVTQVSGLRIDWEKTDGVYRYKVEGSKDGKAWTPLADGSKNAKAGPCEARFPKTALRAVRVTYLGGSPGVWGSIVELELYGDKTITLDPKPSARDTEDPRLSGVRVPDGFELNIFAAPPAVNYPVFVAAAPNGDLYVSSDANGSLDRSPHRGSVVRLRDLDGDGRADEAKRFVADVDSPRGLVWDRDRLYLMHPPHLSAFIDKNGDGVADEERVLVKNIAFGFKDRPADHTSNGVTLGIDGWLYLAIGDFGFVEAEGTDGKKLQLRGGGVVRVRPDGTGLELYSRGTRNILEVGLDPLLNGFARDNTNDGGGWDIRLHHFSGLEEHGYPSLYMNFANEAVAPLADYGGGSGCGALYLSEPGFPAGFGDAFYSADWGRERIYRHKMTPKGATFAADQTEFMTIPRATDLDVDASGHLYVSSWKGATFNYAGEDVGFVVRVTPKGSKAAPLPDYVRVERDMLVKELGSPSHRRRLAAQRELIYRLADTRRLNEDLARTVRGGGEFYIPKYRPEDLQTVAELTALASDASKPLATRVAAIFAIKLGSGKGSMGFLTAVATKSDAAIREYALRALTDEIGDRVQAVPPSWESFVTDSDPRVRRQIAVSLVRQEQLSTPEQRFALARLLADPDPIIAHTAFKGLAILKAADPCFKILDDAKATTAARTGALRALQSIYEAAVVDGLIRRLESESDRSRRLGLIAALARLDHREGFWRGDGWGTRPDTTGPYYQPEAWEASPRIEAALRDVLDTASAGDYSAILRELDRNKVTVELTNVIARAEKDASALPTVVENLARGRQVPASAVPLLVRVAGAKDSPLPLRSDATIALLKAEGDDGLRAALKALASLEASGRDKPEFRRARDAFVSDPRLSARRRQLEALAAGNEGAASAWADAALLVLAVERKGQNAGRNPVATALDAASANPKRHAQIVRAVALIGHQPSARRVLTALGDSDPGVVSAAREAAREMGLESTKGTRPTGPRIEVLKLDSVLEQVAKAKGDRLSGERLFTRLSCVNCHTVRSDETPKGPFLGQIATTYKRRELAEAILVPSKTIAQGFATNVFALEDGRTLTGFVVKEAADAVTLRDSEGKEIQVPTAQIVERTKSNASVMPDGVIKDLTVGEFASLLEYLESLSQAQKPKG